ncbi:valine--tRNA ligase [Patescibacteria group bacterium]|nr:valine--tRNA ligase [Patescibacteria group bacterium]
MSLSSAEMPKAFDSSLVEASLYNQWESAGVFTPDRLPDRNQRGEAYAIMMPPPNVTGVLHLGHALENSLMDTMVRFQRMQGKRAMIVPGTDHAALPTQAKVEKMLMQEGMKNPRQELGREKLLEKIRAFAMDSQATILSQVKQMGTSCDWSHLAFTFDEQRSTAVNEAFCRMYRDGLIYRGYRVVNWSVKGQSTCSDDEVVYVERSTKIYTFKYSKDFPIAISTTRPETKLGDTAVAVHPTDERYQSLIGQTFTVDVGAKQPLQIKIIADENVDKSFGTGALGVTPAHSAIDFEMYEKQKANGQPIGLICVIDKDGKMTEETGPSYQGLTVDEARAKFVDWLRSQNLLEKEEEIMQNVGTSDRFGDIIEAIPMTQWWLDMNKTIAARGKSLKELMREAVTDGLNGNADAKVSIMPDRYQKLYLDRIEHLRDWCLSRQIWWGHRIPVWYRGEEIVASATAPGADWEQDPDTLDTWFSSATWTFSTLGWPEQTADLKTFHPTPWITMGYEIVYLWMMRMILMSTYCLDQIPFKQVYIHGILRDESGKKFSKSSGNNIDPLDIIKKYGADALRWSVLIGTTPGNDSRFYEDKVESGRNLVNKLWNISRYLITTIDPQEQMSGAATLADQWIQTRLQEVVDSVTEKMATSQFSAAGEELRDFTWGDLADWYLEIAKVEKGKSALLKEILETVLKLWHPFVPFVTEAIWQQAGFEGMLAVAEWPQKKAETVFEEVALFEALRTFVVSSRRLRAEQGVEAAKQIAFGYCAHSAESAALFEVNKAWLTRLINAASITQMESFPSSWASEVSSVYSSGFDPMGALDLGKEREKIAKEIKETATYIQSLEAKLANQEFVGKAPAHVTDGMRTKLVEAQTRAKTLEERLQMLGE